MNKIGKAKNNSSKRFTLSEIALLTVALSMVTAAATISLGNDFTAIAEKPNGNGNGAPSGSHFNLNLIGVDKEDHLPNDSNNGHRIFVKEFGKSKIYLMEGEHFAVIDADATDGNGGKFQLPSPENLYDDEGNYIGDGEKYQIWIRPLGKPGTSGNLATCGIDELGEQICSLDVVELERDTGKGKQKFTNVSKKLTTVLYDHDGDETTAPKRVDIFSDEFEDYLWELDNNGLKIIQLRFYPLI